MDAPQLILSMATGTYTVTRVAAGGYRHGIATDGASSTFPVTGAVHPISGNELLRLPEGRRSIETRVLFSPVKLLVGGEGQAHEADVVRIDGADWEVQQVDIWLPPGSSAPGYRCVVQVKEAQEE